MFKKRKGNGYNRNRKKANLILTNTNPLNDLDAIYNHSGVIKDGIYYSREKCDEMLGKIKVKNNE